MKENYPQIDVKIAVGHSGGLYRKVLDGDEIDAAANDPQQSWGFVGEPPKAVIKDSGDER